MKMYRNHWETDNHRNYILCYTESNEDIPTWTTTLISTPDGGCLLLLGVAMKHASRCLFLCLYGIATLKQALLGSPGWCLLTH